MIHKPTIIGHRGWPARFPDNTLAGLLAASTVADAVEIDVRRSKDGKLVLSHDPVLGGLSVPDTPWAVLCQLDLGDGHHPALLDEALAALPGVPAQLEVKNNAADPGFEPDHRLALEAAERTRSDDIVTCFNPETIAAVRRVFPDVATGWAVTSVISIAEAVKHCLDAGHRALVPDHRGVTGPVGDEVAIYPWTVDDPQRARELVEFGVTGIITNDPGILDKTLRSRT